MKSILTFLCFLSFCHAFAQDNKMNNIGFFLGFGSSQVVHTSLDGGPSFDGKSSLHYGLSYSKYINRNLAFETAISYLETEIERQAGAIPNIGLSQKKQLPLELVNLRAGLKFSFLRFLFVNGGLLLDFEVENEIIDHQTGIGLGVGIGAEYIFTSGLNIFVNPYLNQHAILPFQKESYHQRLMDGGIRLGVGYRF